MKTAPRSVWSIRYVLKEADEDLSKKEIADQTPLNRKTIYRAIEEMVENGEVKETRTVSGVPMYEYRGEIDD